MKNVSALSSLSGLGTNTSGKSINNYTLNDQFITDVAAGSVNGTTAEPVGGVRTVTDTNSKISVTGGKLDIQAGTAANEGILYPIQTRVAGKILLSTQNISALPGSSSGWDSNTSGAIGSGIRMGTSNAVTIISGGSSVGTGYTFTTNTDYIIAVVMRATGVFSFIKGGSQFPNWTLIWSDVLTNSNMYPAFPVAAATAVMTLDNIRIPTNLWLPSPVVSDSFDRANGALGTTDGAGHAESTGLGSGGSGLTWTGSTWSISSNAAINTPVPGTDVITNGGFAADTDWTKGAGWSIGSNVATAAGVNAAITQTVDPLVVGTWYKATFTITSYTSGGARTLIGSRLSGARGSTSTFNHITFANTAVAGVTSSNSFTGSIDNVIFKPLVFTELIASVSTSKKDYIADIKVTLLDFTNNMPAGIVLNLDSATSPSSYILALLDAGGNASLYKCVSGVYTVVISASVTYSAGAVLRVIKDGTSYSLYYNNAQVGSTATIGDGSVVNNTLCGLFNTDSGNTLNDFVVYSRGTSGEYNTLDRM